MVAHSTHHGPAASSADMSTAIIGSSAPPSSIAPNLCSRPDAAGARVTKEPVAAEFLEGRDAYVADPEGNFWEVAWSAGDTQLSPPPAAPLPQRSPARRSSYGHAAHFGGRIPFVLHAVVAAVSETRVSTISHNGHASVGMAS